MTSDPKDYPSGSSLRIALVSQASQWHAGIGAQISRSSAAQNAKEQVSPLLCDRYGGNG